LEIVYITDVTEKITASGDKNEKLTGELSAWSANSDFAGFRAQGIHVLAISSRFRNIEPSPRLSYEQVYSPKQAEL